MRVLHVDTGRAWRGGQSQVLHLMRGLERRGVRSALAAPAGSPLLERARAEGFEHAAWRTRGDADPWAVARLAAIASRLRPDVLHAHTAHAHVPAALVGALRGVAVFVSRRVAVPVGAHPLSRLKYALPVERLLCVSRSVRESLRRRGLPDARLAVVPSGIDAEALRIEAAGGADLRLEIGAGPDDPIAGTLATLTREKRPHLLLEAARAVLEDHPRARFVWIGEGPERTGLERAIAARGLGGSIHLLGFRADAPRLLRQFTVAVLPSALEGLGTFVLEAMALGVPVIAARAGGLPELIEHETSGLLVPPDDSQALAAAIARALDHPDERRRWSAAGARTVERFGVERTVDATLALYREALESRRTGRDAGAGDA